MRTHPGWYVLALPDSDQSRLVAERLSVGTVLRHASGRPWLVHTYPTDQVLVNTVGPNRVAVIGFSSAATDDLQRAADKCSRVSDLDTLANTLAGSHILLGSVDGHVRMQGTASGVRRVFTAVVDGCEVACDRADVLAHLGGFAMDETALAIRMLRQIPHPLGELPVWHGVRPVPADYYAVLNGTQLRVARWWRPPEPVLSRAEGAAWLCRALEDAVSTRTRSSDVVYADLSGGFDSTPQAYFAARGPARLHVGTAYNNDPGGGEDLIWARRALSTIPAARHSVFSTEEMPQFYDGLLEMDAQLDDPSDTFRAGPRMRYMMQQAKGFGAQVYLTGLGGDELLFGHPRAEHTLFRSRPLLALRRLRAYQLLERLPARATFIKLFDRRGYRQWLLDNLDRVGERDEQTKPTLSIDWDAPLSWPRWYTADIRAAIVERIRQVCEDVEPLGPDLASHGEISMIRHGARSTRGGEQLGAELGLAFQAPISDDRVAEAVLSVRREERAEPKAFKPLMREAMRGRLPDEFLTRSRKNSGSTQATRGIERYKEDLLALCEQSPLAGLGIIDLRLLTEHAFPQERWAINRDLDTTLNGAVFTRNQSGVKERITP